MNNENLPQDENLSGDTNTEASANSVKETEKATEVSAETGAESGLEPKEAPEAAKAETEAPSEPDKKPAKEKRKRTDSRKLRYGTTATALTVVVIAVVVLINVVAGIFNTRYPLKLDLTKDKLFTLSDDSKKIAQSITQNVTITIFTNEEGFTNPNYGTDEVNTCIRQFTDGVKQYDTLSGGKVTATYVDLDANPTEATKYSAYNVSAYDILFSCGSRSQKISANDLFSYSQDSYTGQASNFESKVEQQLASKITMVTSDSTPEVEFLTGHDEDSTTKTSLTDIFGSNNYSTKDLDITSSAAFDDNCVLAVIPAPTTDYSQDEITKLRTWLNNGGNLDRHLIVIANYKGSCTNLYQFLNVEYGIEVTNQMISETDSSREYNSMGPYYPYGDIASTDYTSELSSKKDLMPICLELLLHKSGSSSDTPTTNTAVVTFPKTAKLTPMADALSQTANSSSKITQNAAESYPITGLAYATTTSYDSSSKAHTTNVMVSGSQFMLDSNVLALTSVANEKTIVVLSNGFTGNQNTLSIPSKSLAKTSMEFSTAQANVFWFVFVLIIPVGLLIAGIVVFRRRRRL